jgi:hypothetical protein
VKWNNYTASSTSNPSYIFKDVVVMYFGMQQFRLRVCSDINSIQISLNGKNPLAIVNRIIDLIDKLKDECMKSLSCFVALENQLNYVKISTDHNSSTYDSNLVVIPLARIIETATPNELNRPLHLPHGKVLLAEEIVRLFEPWLMIRGAKSAYDLFLSYRWGMDDSSFVKALFDALSYFNVDSLKSRAIDVFLDDKRLEEGKPLKSSFFAALINSSVICPVLSFDALQRMINHDPTKEDNLLIEWISSLECLDLYLTNARNNQSVGKVKLSRGVFPI